MRIIPIRMFVRVGNDYYMTSSSFNCTPGLPILHSNDLVNWRIIGPFSISKLPRTFIMCPPADGVWAPSIRFHNDTFYITYRGPGLRSIPCKIGESARPVDLEFNKVGKGLD